MKNVCLSCLLLRLLLYRHQILTQYRWTPAGVYLDENRGRSDGFEASFLFVIPAKAGIQSTGFKSSDPQISSVYVIMNPLASFRISYRSKVVCEAALEIFHNILFAVDDKELVPDVEEFFDEPFNWIDGF